MVTADRLLLISVVLFLSWSNGGRSEDFRKISAVARVMSFLEGFGGATRVTIKNKDGVEYATIDHPSGLIHDCVVQMGDNACRYALMVRCAKPGDGILYALDFTRVTFRYETRAGVGPFDTEVIFRTQKGALTKNGVSIPLKFLTRGPVELPALLEWLKLVKGMCGPLAVPEN
jgi:hypothetical protein